MFFEIPQNGKHVFYKRRYEHSLDEPVIQRRNHPPRFWDSLSTIRLSLGALAEYDRRVGSGSLALIQSSRISFPRRLLRSDARRLREFGAGGGLDLTGLFGYTYPHVIKKHDEMASPRSNTYQQDYESNSLEPVEEIPRKISRPCDGDFEQKLIDLGAFPERYQFVNGSAPENAETIQNMLSQPRGSMSQSSAIEFIEFQKKNYHATSEAMVMSDIIPIIAGVEDYTERSSNIAFHHLEKFDKELSTPVPGLYYGIAPKQINPKVRSSLHRYIIPSNHACRPVVPNFFLECKSSSGNAVEAKRKAMYDGIVGARAMQKLQNYGSTTPIYDNNAYTIVMTYCDCTLKQYAVHPRESANGTTEYYLTHLDSYTMTGNVRGFRSGIIAYRNARDWTKQQRDRLVANANCIAQGFNGATSAAAMVRKSLRKLSSNGESSQEKSYNLKRLADEDAIDHEKTTAKRRK